jgi:hypothetical protein
VTVASATSHLINPLPERSFEEEEADTEAKAEGSGSKEEPPVPGSKLPVGVQVCLLLTNAAQYLVTGVLQAFCSIVFSITSGI